MPIDPIVIEYRMLMPMVLLSTAILRIFENMLEECCRVNRGIMIDYPLFIAIGWMRGRRGEKAGVGSSTCFCYPLLRLSLHSNKSVHYSSRH